MCSRWGVRVSGVCVGSVCGEVVQIYVDLGLCMCYQSVYQDTQVRAPAGVLVYPMPMPSWCTGSASICVALSVAAWWQSSVSPGQCHAMATLHTAALPLILVHEHTACACCRGKLPQIPAPCANTVVKLCCGMSERCLGVETPSDGTGRPCPVTGAQDESDAVPLKFISEV